MCHTRDTRWSTERYRELRRRRRRRRRRKV